MWRVLLAVTGAGALGGVLNALVAGTGLVFPHFLTAEGGRILVPGFAGTIVVGALAALVSFGLYGPFAAMELVRGSGPEERPPVPAARFTVAAFAGAILVGFAGGRWITAEADKQLNHATAVQVTQAAERLAAKASPAPAAAALSPTPFRELLQSLQTDSPLQAFNKAAQLGTP
jgi:hypothetical protein